ncbi:MAG: hypothetical protein DMG22_14450 [Acidobacteria bacterium]|nr:MAG: hypothetical protein DMG22_14450 [Acidobacteriota bacterium]
MIRANEDESGVNDEMAHLINDCEAGEFKKPDKTPPTLVTMLNGGVRFYRRKGRKSLEHVERHVKKLKVGFAGRRSDEITTDHVNQYLENRLDEGMSNASINRELAFRRLAYDLARKAAKIKPEMVPYFEMLTENNRRTGFFEQEQ